LYSTSLDEKRTLNIYLPPGYDAADSIGYPVIYLLDGSADEDFIHITGLVQYLNFPWVNLLPPSIVVGIANVDRKRDYCFPTRNIKDKKNNPTSGGSAKFIDFIGKELEPYIDSAFKTSKTKTIIGQSLGGLLATEILFKTPELFNKYIIISPSLWWDDESLLKIHPAIMKQGKNTKTSIFIAVGKEGAVMEGDSRKLVGLLKEKANPSIKVHFSYFPKENHATIMHQAVYEAFGIFSTTK
jgi:predicted alpha/beta superfamily hydrolase